MPGVTDGQTLVVERGGVAVPVKLAGIPVVDDQGARVRLDQVFPGVRASFFAKRRTKV